VDANSKGLSSVLIISGLFLDRKSFSVLVDRDRWPSSVLKESMAAVLKLTLQPESCSLSLGTSSGRHGKPLQVMGPVPGHGVEDPKMFMW